MNKTKIEYLTHTWNPLAMCCTPVSAGCANCWHLRMADRLAANSTTIPGREQVAYAGKTGPRLKERELSAPLRRKKPSVIGVQFMGDLAHATVRCLDFDSIVDVMCEAKQHTYLVLTKRPALLRGLVDWWGGILTDNIWLGVTVEDQATADERIPQLLRIPAAHYWVSAEPCLGAIDLYPAFCRYMPPSWGYGPDLGAVVLGGESGPGARFMHPDWARSIRDQCASAGVPFFMKQMSKREPIPDDLLVRQLPWEVSCQAS
jgi:protein gp37